MTAEGRDQMVGALDPARSVPMVRDYVLTFFERHLPGAQGPVHYGARCAERFTPAIDAG